MNTTTSPHAVASLTGNHIYCHDTPSVMYAQLAEAFGEQSSEDGMTSWVAVGAGHTVLTFFLTCERLFSDEATPPDPFSRR